MSESNYPLQWPLAWPRTKNPTHSKFGQRQKPVLMGRALDFLAAELHRLGASNDVVSSNVKARLDGKPYADQRRPTDTGVAVYFTLNNKRLVLACDKWNTPEDNIQAIAKHIEAMRGQERWGVGSVERAFTGYAALMPPSGAPDIWATLGILEPMPPLTMQQRENVVMTAWRDKAKAMHPDRPGGSENAMAELNRAKDDALATIKRRAL